MANRNVKSQIKPGRWAVSYENGDLLQYAEKAALVYPETIEPVVDIRAETIGHWRDRLPGSTMEFSFINADATALREWLNLDGATGARLDAGFLPTRRVRLHREADADATADILFYALGWSGMRSEVAGKGRLVYVVSAVVSVDDNGLSVKVGAAF